MVTDDTTLDRAEMDACLRRVARQVGLARRIAALLFVIAVVTVFLTMFITYDDERDADPDENLDWKDHAAPGFWVAVTLVAIAIVLLIGAHYWQSRGKDACAARSVPDEQNQSFDVDVSAQPASPGDRSALSLAELIALERLARSRAIRARESANRWWTVNYWLGGPAIVLAGIAGISSIAGVTSGWAVFTGVLALLGSALVGFITGLNPSRQAQAARMAEVSYSDLATRARLQRRLPAGDTAEVTPEEVRKLFTELYAIDRSRVAADSDTSPSSGG
jgi:hypothetical protein